MARKKSQQTPTTATNHKAKHPTACLATAKLTVLFSEGILSHVGIVVEPSSEGRSNGQLAPVQMLQGLSEHMGRRMPKDRLGILVISKLEQLQLGNVPDEGTGDIPQHGLVAFAGGSIGVGFLSGVQHGVCALHALVERVKVIHIGCVGDTSHSGRVCQSLTDGDCHVVGTGGPGQEGLALLVLLKDLPVGHGNRDGDLLLGFHLRGAASLDLLVDRNTGLEPLRVAGAVHKGVTANVPRGARIHPGTALSVGSATLRALRGRS